MAACPEPTDDGLRQPQAYGQAFRARHLTRPRGDGSPDGGDEGRSAGAARAAPAVAARNRTPASRHGRDARGAHGAAGGWARDRGSTWFLLSCGRRGMVVTYGSSIG